MNNDFLQASEDRLNWLVVDNPIKTSIKNLCTMSANTLKFNTDGLDILQYLTSENQISAGAFISQLTTSLLQRKLYISDIIINSTSNNTLNITINTLQNGSVTIGV